MLTDDRNPLDARVRYDAFISYRSATSRRAARKLQRALVALSKRHRREHPINLFLDTQSLVVGGLDDTIKAALEQSRTLIVLLARGTRDSPWVSVEIEHWLQHGGSLDRLFLVRHDPGLDLDWSATTQNFAHADDLPEALSNRFPQEQKWLDLSSSAFGTDETALVGLYAPIAGVAPEALLMAEADFQQRRRRRARLLTAALSILLILSVVAGTAAVVNGNRAERQATQARADANAAQALLAASDSPSSGIRFGVSAADLSSSSSVRASLLSIADTSAVLNRAFDYPRDEAGYSGDRVAYSHDGRTLIVWGHSPAADESFVVAWDVLTGERQYAARVKVRGVYAIGSISSHWFAICSADGPMVVSVSDGSTTQVTDRFSEAGSCRIDTIDGGVLISTTGSEPVQNSYVVRADRTTTMLSGMPSVVVRRSPAIAVAGGNGGISVVTADGVQRVFDQRVESIEFLSGQGDFAARIDHRRWVIGRFENGRYVVTEAAASESAVDSAPEFDQDRIGRIAEISADGVVTIGDGGGSIAVTGENFNDEFRSATRIVALRGRFVVVYRNAASVVWAPGMLAWLDPAEHQPRDTWRAQRIGWSQAMSSRGADPVRSVCGDRDGVLLRGSTDETVLIDDHEQPRRITRFVGEVDCQYVDAGSGIYVEDRKLRSNSSMDSIAMSPDGTAIAIVQADLPIELLSTAGPTNLSWRIRELPWLETTIFDRRLLLESVTDGQRFVTVAADGTVTKGDPAPIYTLEDGPFAVHPAGSEVIADYLGPGDRTVLATAEGLQDDADRRCRVGTLVGYLPSPGFDQAKDAATSPIPVVEINGATDVDCRTGELVDTSGVGKVDRYEIGDDQGQIVWRADDGQWKVTDWNAMSGNRVRTRDLPREFTGDWLYASIDGDAAAGVASDGSVLYRYRWVGSEWRMDQTIPVQLDEVRGVELVDDGQLAVVVAADNTFEIIDLATGHRVMANHEPIARARRTSRISATVSDGYMTILLYDEGWSMARSAIEIPMSIEMLREQLCTVYVVPNC